MDNPNASAGARADDEIVARRELDGQGGGVGTAKDAIEIQIANSAFSRTVNACAE